MWHSLGLQCGVLLVELFQLLWRLSLEGSLAGETLVHNGAHAPQVRLGIVLERHDHLRGLSHTVKAK